MPNIGITDSLGTDILHDGGFKISSTGDLATVSGLANFKRALFHRLMTIPGSLAHRPTYGIGLGLYQNSINSFTIQQKLAALITEQFLQDPRTDSVSSVSMSTDNKDSRQTIIRVFVKPVGYTEQEMTFTPFSGAE